MASWGGGLERGPMRIRGEHTGSPHPAIFLGGVAFAPRTRHEAREIVLLQYVV